jgi:purine-binding chemotaxis protein CheW
MRQDTPETGSNASRSFIEGLVMLDNRIVSIISIPALMPDAGLETLAAAEA